jgi:hypothetical protein
MPTKLIWSNQARIDLDTDEGVVNTVEIIRVLDGRRDLGNLF